MARQVRALVISVAAVAMLAASAGSGAAGTGIRAVMDGRPISLEQAATLSCHDFDYPVLTCFATAAEMEAAAAAAAAARARPDAGGATGGAKSVASSGYLVAFEDGGFAGAALAISHDYSYLGDIGWNDKISSLRSYGATGHFWEHAPYGGFLYSFSSTSWVSYVGDAYNDRFSSVYLD